MHRFFFLCVYQKSRHYLVGSVQVKLVHIASSFPCSHNFLWCVNEAEDDVSISLAGTCASLPCDSGCCHLIWFLDSKAEFHKYFWAVFSKIVLFVFQGYSFCWQDHNISLFSAYFVSHHPFLRSKMRASLLLLFPCVSQDHRGGVLAVIFLLGLISNQCKFLVFPSKYWKTIRNMDAHMSK